MVVGGLAIGDGSAPLNTRLFTIGEDMYRGWAKHNLANVLVMDTWTWEELNFVGYACFSVMWFLVKWQKQGTKKQYVATFEYKEAICCYI
jgi:hypothetical protein